MRRSKAPGFLVPKIGTGELVAAPVKTPAAGPVSVPSAARNRASILKILSSTPETPPKVQEDCIQVEPNEVTPCVTPKSTAYAIVFAKASSKKHKIWQGDGVLFVQDKSAVAKTSDGKTLGSLPASKCNEITEGMRLFIAGNEVEVLEQLSEHEAASRITNDDVPSKRIALQDKSNANIVARVPENSTEEFLSEDLPKSKIFAVVYAKPSTRKHKQWEGDGYMWVTNGVATAKTDCGKSLGSTKLSSSVVLESGTRLMLGGKEMELVEEVTEEEIAKRKQEATAVTSCPVPPKPKPANLLLSRHFISPSLNKPVKYPPGSGLTLPDPSDDQLWQQRSKVTPVIVDPALTAKLRPHQRRGVIFLYECIMGFKNKDVSGAILADEMGLGKTLQCIALIWTLLRQGPFGLPVANNVLIVTPSSLTGNWAAEFGKWLGNRLTPYVVDGKHKAEDRGSSQRVVIVSYEMLVRRAEAIGSEFDLVICDEAHRLKNADTKVSQTLNEMCVQMRILLTGTPIQNDLQELYCLVDFANPNYLGSYAQFRRQFEDPIQAARQPDANDEVRSEGEERANELSQLTSVFILRRTQSVLDSYLPGKKESVVMCRPTEAQQAVYNALLSQLDVAAMLGDSGGHLALISALRKVANHPALLVRDGDTEMQHKVDPSVYSQDEAGVEDSSKLMVVMRLLEELWSVKDCNSRERIVLVSGFTQTLDMLQEVCRMNDYPTLRLDGSTPSIQRTDIVTKFNKDSSQFVFLLSARAGGVGLNLIGASRLVLYDSDWNPATDLQAMARIWRDGQQRAVHIYRLLTAGTIDEKIFQRQLSKQTLAGGIIDSASSNSVLLSRDELKEVFQPCEDQCWTHASLRCACAGDGNIPAAQEEPSRVGQMGQSAGTLRLEELMGWQHYGPPFSEEMLSHLSLSPAEPLISFIFSTSCGSRVDVASATS